jgi:hypothetical protein
MSKRPSIGPETVVRKSRLAAKGEAAPASDHHHHPVSELPAAVAAPVQASAPVAGAAGDGAGTSLRPAATVGAAEGVLQSTVDGLLATLAERDRQLEQMHADLLRAEQERSQERAVTVREHDRLVLNLATATATIDELRGRIGDRDPEELRADLARLEQERLQERAVAVQERDSLAAALAAANASLDELRGRIGDRDPEELRADLARIEQARLQERAVAVQERDSLVAALAAANATLDELRGRIGDRDPEELRADLARLEQARLQEQVAAGRERDSLAAALATADAALEALRGRIGDRDPAELRADLLRIEQERLQERAAAAREHDLLAASLAAANSALEELHGRIGDRAPAELRADLLRFEQERLQERAAAARGHDQLVGNLAAADATIDELRNRVGDLRSQLDLARAEVSRLIEQHAIERQRLLDHQKGEIERLLQATAAVKGSPNVGVLGAVRRWLFGDGVAAGPASPVNHKATPKPASSVPRPTGAAPPVKPTVARPVGPPTAPKVLNRRPVS